jgi:UDP-2,4-diacetamido-2,4,6-trideoxy-beta-L-altropyranose hydrolase
MRIVIRVDGSERIGGGHAMRCLALAQAARDARAQVAFAMAEGTGIVARRLADEDVELVPIAAEPGSPEDAAKLGDLARGADWLVVDGYRFSPAFAAHGRANAKRMLRIDDLGGLAGDCCDLLLNPNVGMTTAHYPTIAPNRLMLGPDYALLRRRARRAAALTAPTRATIRRIAVSFGASDPADATRHVVDRLLDIGGFEIDVIVGAAYPGMARLRDRIAGRRDATVHTDVDEPAEIFAGSDLVVCNGGGTLWEVAAVGRPALLVTVAGNQAGNVAWFDAQGLAHDLGAPAALSADALRAAIDGMNAARRTEIAAAARRLVDARGAMRAIEAMSGIAARGTT